VEAATLGTVLLWAAVAAVATALLVPGRHGRTTLWAGVGLVWAAVLVLVFALVGGDFTLDYVARTTSRATPWPYRLAALWGGMEGSLLFYAAMTAAVGAYGVRHRGRVERSVVAVVVFGLLLLTALGSNPFGRLDVPAVDGGGLLAILQHPAMIYHPPILYLGLTMLIVPFALTVGWVWSGGERLASLAPPSPSPSAGWLLDTRRWLTWSWTWLTVGMAAGANWAYVELGWGGYWAWDPVENTALMPWIAATAFLHTSRVYQRDGRLRRSTVALSLAPFALSVLGVYLTRSGVTGSIHAFAEDPVIGRVLLVAAMVVTLFVIGVVVRAGRGTVWERVDTGRSTWLALSAGLLVVSLVFILVGSAYPAFLQVFWGSTVVVGPRFFIATVLPVAILIAALIGFALGTTWGRARIKVRDIVVFASVVIVAAGVAGLLAIEAVIPGILLLAVAAGAAVLLALELGRQGRPGRLTAARLAHLGVALVLLGAGASALGTEFHGPMVPGDVAIVGPHRIELKEVRFGEADRFIYAEGVFLLDGLKELRPQIRAYGAQQLPVAEPVLRSTPMVDVIVAVGVVTPGAEGFEVSVFVRPMVWWVWAGAVVLAIAGFSALSSGASSGAGRRRPAREGRPRTGTTIEGTG
jgi:cytochrome c-type biogenesis protein CcmF